MTEPITLTAATIVALAASKFIESASKKVGEELGSTVLTKAGDQVNQLWQRIKTHFTGNKRAEAAITQVETEQSTAALTKLEVYLDDELEDPQNQTLADDLRQIAQQIINVGEQNQTQKAVTFNIDAKDNARVNAVGDISANQVSFGDSGT